MLFSAKIGVMYISAENLLKDKGLRVTHGRVAVLQILQEATKPLSLKDIQKELPDRKLNQATTYRILTALHAHNLIQTVSLEHGHAHWELADHHHHLICEKCGKMENLPECKLKNMESEIYTDKGYTDLRHNLDFFGTCETCAKKSKSAL